MNVQEKALIKETKALIKEVEAGQTGRAAWIAIQDRVRQLYVGRTQVEVGDLISKKKTWVSDLLAWDSAAAEPPFSASVRGRDQDRNMRGATKILRDPEQRRRAIAELDANEIEAVVEDANDAAIERQRAKRSEHQAEPTAGGLMGDDKFDPAEYWADTLVIRVNRNARELDGLIRRAGGLLFGTMKPSEAFDLLHEAERLIAEARAAAMELDREAVA